MKISKALAISKATTTGIGFMNTSPTRTNNDDSNKRLSSRQTPKQTPGRPLLTQKNLEFGLMLILIITKVVMMMILLMLLLMTKHHHHPHLHRDRQIGHRFVLYLIRRRETVFQSTVLNHLLTIVYCLSIGFNVSELNSILKSLNL